jgi:hypothetical protein
VTGLPHDHPSVRTVRATLERQGSGLRVAIPESDADAVPAGEVVRVVLDGTERYALVDSHLTEGRPLVPGVYDTPDLARDPGGAADRLRAWAADRDRGAGDSVLLDALDEGHRYGLRAPGEAVTYRDRSTPDEGLASIARDLDGE